MTVNELIARLEEYREELGDVEVRLMTQSNWPFENGIMGLASGTEINEAGDDAEDEDEDEAADERLDANRVYIVEGDQICYGTGRAWKVAH